MSKPSRRAPTGWGELRLGDTGRWTGGGTPSKAIPEFWNKDGVPWVSPKDMKVWRIRDAQDHITRQAIGQSAAQSIPAGAVLLVTRSGILEHSLPVAVTDVETTVNQDLKALTPHAGISPEFIATFLSAHAHHILETCAKDGTTVASIDTAKLLDYIVLLPPTGEQERVVAASESYTSRIAETSFLLERIQRNLKRYRASVLKAAVEGRLVPLEAELARTEKRDYEPASELLKRILVERRRRWEVKGRRGKYEEPEAPDTSNLPRLPQGWCWATVDQLAADVRYGSSAKCGEDPNDSVPVIRMGNILDGELKLDSLKYLPSEHEEFPELFLLPGDLLFNRTNSAELVGKSAVYRGQLRQASFASYLIRVRFVEEGLSNYIAAFLNSPSGRRWVSSVVTQQVGQANVNGTKLRDCVVPLPPSGETIRIVFELERLSSNITAGLAASLRNEVRCARLRQSILKWAFEGKLVDQDPTDEPASVLLDRIRSEREAMAPAARRTRQVAARATARRKAKSP